MELDYFYGSESEQFTFYRIPKVLITSPEFKNVSDSAKLLYGLMLDRTEKASEKAGKRSRIKNGAVYTQAYYGCGNTPTSAGKCCTVVT